MSSFISNFRRELPVTAALVLSLLACEVGLRLAVRRASVDAAHIDDIPRIVSALASAGRPTVLFLGNSLTRAGVVPRALELRGAHVALIHPDDTTIVDWLYLYKRNLRARGAAPDVLVVGFAADQLSDATEVQVDRLGYLGGFLGLREAFRHDVPDFESRVSYVLANLSCAFANRHRIRNQLFAALIPHYKTSAQVLNKGFGPPPGTEERRPPRAYKRLSRFLDLMEGTGTKVVFVSIPVPAYHELDPELRRLIAARGARLLDLRRPAGLTDRHFLDGYHLAPAGGEVFSRELSRRLLGSADLRGLLERASGTGR